jgi:Flp pilus assembly pilin Flp
MPYLNKKSLALAFLRDNNAASAIEYALIAAGIAVAISATITVLSGNVQGLFVSVLTAL